MARDYTKIDPDEHQRILQEKILRDPREFLSATPQDNPRAIITAGQPGAGKGRLVRDAKAELHGNAVTVDPDELRGQHPQANTLRQQHPYTWSSETHGDASQWAGELREAAIAQRKNIILDTTMPRADVIKELQAKGYDVEIRAIATHRLESELGVDERFGRGLDQEGHGRYVPKDVREAVYNKLPAALDDVAKQTGVPVQIYDREGKLHFDSRTSPKASPGQALETARNARLTPERLNDLHQSTDAQRQWHRDLPERVPNERVSPDTARNLLNERQHLQVERGVQRLHNEVGGLRAAPSVVKGVGIAGAAYGAYDAKHQVDAAIDTARSNREQWVRGGEESANQAMKTAVTGGAATVGAIPGAAAGTLTSPVTGPVGPIAGGVITGGAAAYGAEKLYEDSRLQQFSKYLGREAGQLGYDYVSKEGRLLRQVNGLNEALQKTTDPAERTRLQGRLAEASTAFGKETERNGRYFEGRAGIDKNWEQMHARFPKVDKNEVNGALDKHIDAGKKPADAVRGAWSDAVHEKYPRALPHQPLENYRAMDSRQLSEQHRRFAGEVAQDRQSVQALAANKDSQNNLDQGWPRSLAQQRQAGRVQEGLNELWRDTGHLGAVRDAMQERGMQPPELPVELRPRDPQAAPTRSGQVSLTPEQQRHHALAQEQLSPALSARGHDAETVDRVNAAAVSHAQAHTRRGEVRAFHLSKDGERVAMVQEGAPVSEFSVRQAQSQTSEQHLAQAHQTAHTRSQAPQETTRTAEAPAAPTQSAPERSMA
ncbi:zeta toxin family protein [Hydrogenophaga sp. MI9]|uniref:zeta toxin family protein n=1 Tax=Hydrogenophaga sp. MI9 TaxID=3453719 RepID=UPI003EECBE3D